LNKAAELFITDSPKPIQPNWGHSDTYTWLGIIELEDGNKEGAKDHFEKALIINPNNSRVKNQLMPSIKN